MMKTKTKLKKNSHRSDETNTKNIETSLESLDYSQLRKPIETNLSNLKHVVQLLEKGSDEVKAVLAYECDIIYECRFCRSLFRSLANFISHKRVYCLEKHNVSLHIRNSDPLEQSRYRDSFVPSDSSVDLENRENSTNDRTIKNQSVNKEPKKDLTSVVAMLTKRRNKNNDYKINPSSDESDNSDTLHITGENEEIFLEILDSKQAAYQTVRRPDSMSTADPNLSKNKVNELKNIFDRNSAIFSPDGHLLSIDDINENGNQFTDGEEFNTDVNPLASDGTTCTICNAKFSSKKTLAFHLKSKHMHDRMSYHCPCCSSAFTSRWSVYRHLIKSVFCRKSCINRSNKVHRKSNVQVRKLRSQIQAKALKREFSKNEKVQKESTQNTTMVIEEERVINKIRRCSGCDKRFERRAALLSHMQICQKCVMHERRGGTYKNKRVRKIIPKRLNELMETERSIDNVDKTILRISKENEAPMIDSIDTTIPVKTKPLNHKSRKPIVNSKSELAPINWDYDRSSQIGDTESLPVVSKGPTEIAIRVKDVSSLSKDVWDQIGQNDNATDNNLPLSNSNYSPEETSAFPDSTITIKDPPSSVVVPDIPDVIYTTVNDSPPVALSVLGSEKKLGIQYRGIHLPTVTLEKIDTPRCRINDTIPKPSASLNTTKECQLRLEKINQSSQIRHFQCLPCNRIFTSTANLRRHISFHKRRNRYRCKLCDGFKTFLKCDMVAHCNKEHDAKNNRAVLAELVIEAPKNYPYGNSKLSNDPANKINVKSEVIDVSSPTIHQTNPTTTIIENEIPLDKVSKSVENSLDLNGKSDTRNVMNIASKPPRGRPRRSKRKSRIGRKKKMTSKTRNVKHVSPPRLLESSSDETSDIIKSVDETSGSKSKEFSRVRAPSRLDSDPELRKMVMEVIFGSTQKGTNEESQELENHSTLNNVNSQVDVTSDHQSRLSSPKPEKIIIAQSNVFTKMEANAGKEMQSDIVKPSTDNIFFQHYGNYALNTVKINQNDSFCS